MLKPLTLRITTNCGKFLKKWKYQTTLHAFLETCMQVKKQQLKPDVERWTGSDLGKESVKAVYCDPAYLTYMQSWCCCSVAQSCPTLCDPIGCSMPDFPVIHHLPEDREAWCAAIHGSQRVGHDWATERQHITQNAGLDVSQARIKIAWRNINNLRYADNTILMTESNEELKSPLVKLRGKSEKADLKTQHSKN